jgi:hypothetical protein
MVATLLTMILAPRFGNSAFRDIGNPNNAEVIDLAISSWLAAHPRKI